MAIAVILSRKLYETLGSEAAEAMVNWMDSVERNRAELREVSDLSFARIDARFGQMEARFDTMEARFEQTLEVRCAAMTKEIEGVRTALERGLKEQLRWIIALWSSSMIGLAALALVVLRWGR